MCLAGCRDDDARHAIAREQQLHEVQRALVSFFNHYGSPPVETDSAKLSMYYDKKFGITDLSSHLMQVGLDIDCLQQDELLLFALCGVRIQSDDSKSAWVSVGDFVDSSVAMRAPQQMFIPDSRRIRDVDRDGWPEYEVAYWNDTMFGLGSDGKITTFRRVAGAESSTPQLRCNGRALEIEYDHRRRLVEQR
jgi:hypothetical protein